jgi:hypothetical protein
MPVPGRTVRNDSFLRTDAEVRLSQDHRHDHRTNIRPSVPSLEREWNNSPTCCKRLVVVVTACHLDRTHKKLDLNLQRSHVAPQTLRDVGSTDTDHCT